MQEKRPNSCMLTKCINQGRSQEHQGNCARAYEEKSTATKANSLEPPQRALLDLSKSPLMQIYVKEMSSKSFAKGIHYATSFVSNLTFLKSSQAFSRSLEGSRY